MWWGIWFLCIAKLRDGYWVSIVSPLFVMLLLFKGSGIPMQEKQVRRPSPDQSGDVIHVVYVLSSRMRLCCLLVHRTGICYLLIAASPTCPRLCCAATGAVGQGPGFPGVEAQHQPPHPHSQVRSADALTLLRWPTCSCMCFNRQS